MQMETEAHKASRKTLLYLTEIREVQEKVLTRCRYRILKILIAVLIIIIIALLCGFVVFFYNQNTKENEFNRTTVDTNITRLRQELCVSNTDSASGCLLCPNSWILHGDDCYYYSDVTYRTWNQSRDQCEKMGADLLVIKDQEQKEFIQINLRDWREEIYWIGLHHDGDGWRWVDGEHYNSSLIQIKTQSGGCVSMTRSDYLQEDCRSTYRWICLKKAVRI
ncbi:killer cell lectin-like receptor subfamily B member 1B allele B [Bufo gargarizans]|uniref:killer cell lectin-like receptor subfamily B member 1B allele B n=1 Tax=Bufo gargarizans TaxID=30331 RepID=UPI001CF3DABB|nr:killer cell lectin-like receptor subfamily B member 1B allele B [Bufo gargarizans]